MARELPPPRPPPQHTWAKPWEHVPDWSKLPVRRWLYGEHYIREHVTVTVAPGGLGKSALCLAECIAMATGRAILGVEPDEPGVKVWYWNGEDPLEETVKRVAAICIHYGIDQAEFEGKLFIGSGLEEGLVIARQETQRITINEPHIDALRDLFTTHKIDLAVIDPFVSSHEVSENDNMAINAVAKAWKALAREAGAAIELVHHVRKGNGQDTTVEDARGAVALIGAARSARVLNVMSTKQAESVGVTNPRSHFNVSNGKANLVPPPEKVAWYKFESIHLGNGEKHGVGCVTPWQWPDIAAGVTADHLYAVQMALARQAMRANEQSKHEWVGHLVADIIGADISDRDEIARKQARARVRKMLREWVDAGALVIEQRDNGNGRNAPWMVPGKLVELGTRTYD